MRSRYADCSKILEVRFLANLDPNLHFALLTDLPDSIRGRTKTTPIRWSIWR